MNNLSGRRVLWDISAREISRKPIFGQGLTLGSRNVNKHPAYAAIIAHEHKRWSDGNMNIHSSILEAVLSAGYLGAVPLLLLIFVIMPVKAIYNVYQDFSHGSIFLLMLVAVLMIRAVFVSNLVLCTPDGVIFVTTLITVFASEKYVPQISATSESEKSYTTCLLYTSPSPRDATLSRMPSSA